jgi:GNAT superfamily N-acetyltransferase
MQIRSARQDDAKSLTPLLTALGYPAEAEEVGGRLRRLLEGEAGGVLVAEEDGEPIALLAFQLIELLERRRPVLRITSLVTAAGHRRGGVATALLDATRSVAETHGCDRLEVTTKPERADALAFYLDAGFYERPRRLVRHLGEDAS